MATIDVVRDAKPRPIAPVDEAVIVPESVKRAAALAESFYKPQPTAEELAAQEAARVAREAEPPLDPAAPPAATTTAAATTAPPATITPPVSESEWENRYKAMKGRYDQSQGQLADMQTQMSQLGNELLAAQQAIQQINQGTRSLPKLITAEEEQNYGTEFLGVVKKAAQEEYLPVVEGLKGQVDHLQKQVSEAAKLAMWSALDAQMPEWRTINRSPAFKSWLMLRDPYSGAIRQKMITEAFDAAQAPRVLQFFKGFVTDEAATGSVEPRDLPQPQQQAPARKAAVALETLAAPGRARSAPYQTAAEKPVFTRDQIRRFYSPEGVRAYVGREADRRADEQLLFEAQREGRVR